MFFQVVLMIVFGRVESFGRNDFGNDWCRKFSGTVEFQYFGNGGLFLSGIKVKYGGSVLMSDVGTLTVPSGRIVDAEKNVEQLVITYLFRVISDFDGFGMSGIAPAYLFLRRIYCRTAGITDSG